MANIDFINLYFERKRKADEGLRRYFERRAKAPKEDPNG